MESNIGSDEVQAESVKDYRERDYRDKNDSIYTQGLFMVVITKIMFLLGYTLPKIVNCLDCNQKFRTYVPNTDCLLPDGNVVFYKEPQTLCPECTGGVFLSINEDLFPHMVHDN